MCSCRWARSRETVTVSGASPIVDVHTVEQRQVIDRQIIDTIPTGKSFQSYAPLVPGMEGSNSFFTSLSQDVGGMSTGQTQRMFISLVRTRFRTASRWRERSSRSRARSGPRSTGFRPPISSLPWAGRPRCFPVG